MSASSPEVSQQQARAALSELAEEPAVRHLLEFLSDEIQQNSGLLPLLERLGAVAPDTLLAVARSVDASDDRFERDLIRYLFREAPSEWGAATLREDFELRSSLALVAAALLGETMANPYASIRRGREFMATCAASLDRSPQWPRTVSAVSALALVLWAACFEDPRLAIDPSEHEADLRYVEEHLDVLLARRDFIAGRRPPRPGRIDEGIALLRVAAEGVAPLLDGAL